MLPAQSLRTNSSRISAPYLIRLDNDQNGKLDDGEFANAGAIRAGDGDSDGKLTKNEYRSFFEQQLSKLDIDKSGIFTKGDWR